MAEAYVRLLFKKGHDGARECHQANESGVLAPRHLTILVDNKSPLSYTSTFPKPEW